MLLLIKTYCLPLLLYRSEYLDCTLEIDSCIIRSWNYIYWKLFQINDSSVIELCSSTNMIATDDILFKRHRKVIYTQDVEYKYCGALFV